MPVLLRGSAGASQRELRDGVGASSAHLLRTAPLQSSRSGWARPGKPTRRTPCRPWRQRCSPRSSRPSRARRRSEGLALSPRIGRSLALSRPWSASTRLLAYWVVSWWVAGSSWTIVRASALDWSVVTSAGAPCELITVAKNPGRHLDVAFGEDQHVDDLPVLADGAVGAVVSVGDGDRSPGASGSLDPRVAVSRSDRGRVGSTESWSPVQGRSLIWIRIVSGRCARHLLGRRGGCRHRRSRRRRARPGVAGPVGWPVVHRWRLR